MLEESHLGHLKFWLSEFDVVVAVVAVVVEEEGDGAGDGEEGGVLVCNTTPLVEIFLSPAIRPAPPNSSWIIFSPCRSTTIQKQEKQTRVSLFEVVEKLKKVVFVVY